MKFKGNIVITDPCYLMEEYSGSLPFDNYLMESTLYGDWSCTTFRCDKTFNNDYSRFMNFDNKIGEFCADGGEVCVVYLEDVLKINPDFAKWALLHPWCATVIPNFDGDVYIKCNELTGSNSVFGNSEKYNFFTIQTGL